MNSSYENWNVSPEANIYYLYSIEEKNERDRNIFGGIKELIVLTTPNVLYIYMIASC